MTKRADREDEPPLPAYVGGPSPPQSRGEMIAERFSATVAAIVLKLIKLADQISNVRSVAASPPVD